RGEEGREVRRSHVEARQAVRRRVERADRLEERGSGLARRRGRPVDRRRESDEDGVARDVERERRAEVASEPRAVRLEGEDGEEEERVAHVDEYRPRDERAPVEERERELVSRSVEAVRERVEERREGEHESAEEVLVLHARVM